MVNYCLDIFGSLDILINNAGVAHTQMFDAISEDEWDEVIDTNLKGVFNCCQAVVPRFITQKSGVIINISSVWGMVGASCEVHYSAAKAGVIGLTKALAKELGNSNIRVNCVAPGIIETEMISDLSKSDLERLRLETPLQKIGSKEDIAKAVYFLSSEDSNFITGQVLSPNGGFVI
jgi:3-oxoacyl-[acyl-carrier protein] reductase